MKIIISKYQYNLLIENNSEKNKKFLGIYVDRVASIQPLDADQRAAMFEERLKARQTTTAKKVVSFEPEVIEIVPESLSIHNSTETTLLKEEIRLLKERIILLEKHCFRT